MADWRLEVLGGARLLGSSEPIALQRRVAAVLAYLALEGPTPKYRLAGMLWPDAGEERARNNMRQLLHRLRVAAGAELVLGGDVIALSERVVTDAVQLEAHVFAGRHTEALALAGTLLGAMDFDDCPDFEAWIAEARDQLGALRRRAAAAEADAREQRGDLHGALDVAERLLALDPHAEDAYRRLMRIHYLAGDRSAALALYQRCRRMVADDFGADPHPETVALARDVERGTLAARPVKKTGRALPLSVLRPPVLVGRAREWSAMEVGWEAGQLLFLMGDPGVGKTRLALDFAASRGSYIVFSARPGDADVPYSLYVRHVRAMLAERPALRTSLPGWIVEALARLVPELSPAGAAPPPLRDEGDRVRFLDALSEVLRRCTEGLAAFVTDDLQFADLASLEIGAYAHARFFRQGAFPRIIDCCRRGELTPALAAMTRRLEEGGLLTHLDLEPLSSEAVGELLSSLALPGVTALRSELSRYTGNNPLFITETVKHLVESGSLERGFPERLPPPGRVRLLIQHRLSRLSASALQLAQVAALARTDFDLDVASAVLDVDPSSLAADEQELTAAQILRDTRFVHDLVLEAVRASIPSTLSSLLHRRLAVHLERRAAPATIAQHWIDGAAPLRAVPFLLAAAEADASALRHAEAETLYQRAVTLLEAAGDTEGAQRVRARLSPS
ncbi:transcriptional regulator, AfsR/DnrI/RedD family protein [Minicystis rosea]|nr:transcriptional regulator, AfsR/DnrI/RedD family protein [Minicystis rosea]